MPKLRQRNLILLLQPLAFFVSTLAMRVPALARATVTVMNVENGLKRSVKTDDAGRFSFPQLKPGTYAVKAEADRFETQQNNTVSAGLGQKQTVDFKLNIASATESILVQEQVPLINAENP